MNAINAFMNGITKHLNPIGTDRRDKAERLLNNALYLSDSIEKLDFCLKGNEVYWARFVGILINCVVEYSFEAGTEQKIAAKKIKKHTEKIREKSSELLELMLETKRLESDSRYIVEPSIDFAQLINKSVNIAAQDGEEAFQYDSWVKPKIQEIDWYSGIDYFPRTTYIVMAALCEMSESYITPASEEPYIVDIPRRGRSKTVTNRWNNVIIALIKDLKRRDQSGHFPSGIAEKHNSSAIAKFLCVLIEGIDQGHLPSIEDFIENEIREYDREPKEISDIENVRKQMRKDEKERHIKDIINKLESEIEQDENSLEVKNLFAELQISLYGEEA